MLISTRGRYALRIMLELAQYDRGKYIPLPLIAERQEISEKYLESIISVLGKAGLVEGLRGKGGGYRLSRELKDYSVGEILRLSEGSLAPVACLDGEVNRCPRSGKSWTSSLTAIWTAFRWQTCCIRSRIRMWGRAVCKKIYKPIDKACFKAYHINIPNR